VSPDDNALAVAVRVDLRALCHGEDTPRKQTAQSLCNAVYRFLGEHDAPEEGACKGMGLSEQSVIAGKVGVSHGVCSSFGISSINCSA
jgi:hypothetical protein